MSVQEASGGEIKSKAPPEAPNYAEGSDERSSRGTITGENSNITVGDSCGVREHILYFFIFQFSSSKLLKKKY